MDIRQLLKLAIEKNVSDLHIIPGYYPSIRSEGELYQLKTFSLISKEEASAMIYSILNQEQKENLIANREIDFSLEIEGYRFRTNIYFAQNNLCGSFRLISTKIKTIEELNLPPILHKCADFQQGMVLVTGPTGEGKSTTLAAIINEINMKYSRHIITIEDPIEYIYPKEKSIISQRELHQDTHGWNIALKSVLRQDPDVILVGEMRDYDTIQLVITAAETGHLVFSTLHTNSAPETVDRIVDVFPSYQQNQVKNQLSQSLKMVVTQRLLPQINSNKRIPALEILINTPAVSATIREGKNYLLNNILETTEEEGSILFEKYLLKLYQTGKISKETAFSYALRPRELAKFIR